MALTPEQELREHELRIEQMGVNIEKMRADMRAERVKITMQVVGLAVAAFAAGAAWMHFLRG